jgi:hypothetical protein
MTMLLASVFLNVGPAFGQSTSSGTVVGTASDPQGAVIGGVTVTLSDVTLKTSRTVPTNEAGGYVFVNVPPGTYSISASMPGFSTTKIDGLVVSVGTQTTANLKMSIGQTATTVEVQASNADLQTMNASTGTTVDPAMVESLPAIGRDVATFATMQPGVTPGGNVAGTTADQATFQLDGGSNSSDMDGTQAGYTSNNVNSSIGGFFSNAVGPGGVVPMPQDSVEEFKVSTTGQTADFNNSSGSQAQIVTKRGHDAVHGTVYEYYLDNNMGANTWQNNFPSAYTAKPSYHFNRFGAAAGGPIAPTIWGGKTYFFANYEGFRYPLAATYERTVPSYEFLQLGQLTFGTKVVNNGTGNVTVPNTFSAAQLTAADPRHIGMNQTLANFYKTQLPQAPVGNNGPASGLVGTFDSSCGALQGAVCDGVNIIGYKANVLTPQSSNFLATRMDHDFGAKWHLMASYRYYSFTNLTSNQVDIGGALPGDTLGVPKALAARPQQPWYFVVGLTTNISSSLTNDFHYSYLRNFWQWKGAGAPPQVPGAGGAIEPLGESTASGQALVLSPYNVNAQNIRTRIWDGKDNFFTDNLTKLKGAHLIQFGGQFQHNFNYHQRTDNGASINYTPTYQIGGDATGGNIAYSSSGIGGLATTGAYRRIADTYYGLVTATQVANTYSNVGGTLSLNAPLTAIGAHTTIPYYNIYATDTWHARPSLTLNYGLSYAIEMPPSERDGNQVMFTDISGNAIRVQDYLNNRKTAALAGQVYNPEIGFALLKNVAGGRKYPYDPYYAAFSPRLSAAWNPRFQNAALSKLFGDGATVIRGGYGRIYGRINGDVQVLNPLLSPGLILATQCKYAQSPVTGSGTCTQTNFNETTAYRFGTVDGLAPALTNAALPATLTQPYHPGFDGPGVSIASPVDPTMRPNDVDTFNLSIQRQVNRKMLVEAGYIGRLVHHEYIMQNPNAVPYMMSAGGQSFQSAYLAIETAFGCATSASLCSTTAAKAGTKATSVNPNVAPQPFFENALNPAYCSGYSSCTAAVVAKQASNFGSQNVFTIWQALDNNTNGTGGSGFNFARSMMGTPTSSATYGGAGQVVTGLSIGTANGYSNYHGGYVSFKASDFHGLTFQENLTISKALGLNAYNQSTSSIAAVDSFNLREQYGRQSFDQRVIFNTFIVYQIPYYREQNGIIGRLAGGWTLSPVLTAGTGQPLQCVTNNNGQNFGGEDGATFTDSNENCVFTSPYSGGRPQTYRNVAGSTDPLGVAVGTNVKPPGGSAAVNFFSNPAAVFDSVRPLLLGLDSRSGGGGRISGLGYLNVDLSVKKRLVVYEKVSMEFSGVLTNVMNHLDFANPSLSLQSVTNWGATKTQGNAPRQIQMGVRASF